MPKFNKTVLQSYILTNCKRRLFLEIGKNKPSLWFDPVRKIPLNPPERFMIQNKYLKEKGKEYEQMVYKALKRLSNMNFKIDKNGDVTRSNLNEQVLNDFHAKIIKNKSTQVLLEYQHEIPESFFIQLFPKKKGSYQLPIEFSEQRPDIIFIGNELNKHLTNVHEIIEDGSIREVPKGELNKRIGISVFDIKYIQEENVGKKHFLEIYYYLKTLASYLGQKGLDSKFYVRANLNGIFPLKTDEELKKIKTIDDLFQLEILNIISWKEANRIFNRVKNVLRNLWKKAPCPIENVKLNIHQGCGHCYFIEDCKNTLNVDTKKSAMDWSLKVIPFTSQSISEQLTREYKLNTIGEVYKNIDKIKVGAIPKPLYSEIPTLKMKAEALINDAAIYPKVGQTHSYAIPRYSPIALNFDVEYDRNNDKIFAVGIYLKMFVSSKLNYHGIFDNWWRIWKECWNTDISDEELCDELNDYLIQPITLENVMRFRKNLKNLKGIQINLKGEKTNVGTEVIYRYCKVNKDITKESEAFLTIQTIFRLNLILEICNILEDHVAIENGTSGYFFCPDTSIFYWSKNQLEHLQDMMQRNLDEVISKDTARKAYESIVMYFTPSDVEVTHPYQHKKLFDVQAFAESFVGIPEIINYTWHGIARKIKGLNFSPRYWVPHFNYLDSTNWFRYLAETDPAKKRQLENGIKKQLSFKLRIINDLRYYFQKEGNFAMSKNSRVISKTDYKSAILPSKFHDISHIWYLFSRLNSALAQQDDEYYRTIFPEHSIGKLFSAKVDHLQCNAKEGKFYYNFDLLDLSSNMKLKEGDRVLLIPNYKRGMKLDFGVYKWLVYIERLVWDPVIEGNHVKTGLIKANLFEEVDEDDMDPKQQIWFLYPLSSDVWSNKLYGTSKKGLLERENFGTTWLGARLAYLWDIRKNLTIKWPKKWYYYAPAIYLYAPEVLKDIQDTLIDDQLLTTIYPKPDNSQEMAIKNSLNNVISGILGPPGTGKSQTISALIDEYVLQRKKLGKTSKILVTSFSYSALKVVIDKVRKGTDNRGRPTPSSKLQMIYIRSESQDPIPPLKGYRKVDDLMKKTGSWKLNGKKRTVTEKTKHLEESLERSFIIFANAHQLYHLKNVVDEDFAFDLICVDEASQLPADYFMSSLQFIYKPVFQLKDPTIGNTFKDNVIKDKNLINKLELKYIDPPEKLTKVVIVGDHNQLPPVRMKTPPKDLENVLDSLFMYYVEGHKIPSKQLKINYRSHEDIVEFTSLLGLYEGLTAFSKNSKSVLLGDLTQLKKEWVKQVLDPKKVVSALIHHRKFEIGISVFEADLVSAITVGYYNMRSPRSEDEERDFWTKRVGVVAPHNAQGRTIIRKIFKELKSKSHLSEIKLMDYLKNTVYSVEKFQGSDRDLIITSIGLSDEDKIRAEEDFIYNLNRFNVLTSRAKNKVIFISSKQFIDYIPEDRKILESASKIYSYVEEFCNKEMMFEIENEHKQKVKVLYKYKE